MDNDNFFVDLPSDSSMTVHASNHGGEYTVDLPHTLNLSSHQWEVGLVEAIFTQEWNPLHLQDLWVQLGVDDGAGGFCVKAPAFAEKKTVDPSKFDEVWEKILAPMFTKVLTEANLWKDGAVKIAIDKASKKATITITPLHPAKLKGCRLEMSQDLLRIMGFTSSHLKADPFGTAATPTRPARYFFSDTTGVITTGESTFAPSVDRGTTSLWIYTDIIKPHFTGHTLAPLLRVIGVNRGVDSTTVRVERFNTVDYYGLKYDDIRSIHVKITNQSGLETIQFSLPVVLKLHFRRRKV